jgi:tRNA G46 methylase TrmB
MMEIIKEFNPAPRINLLLSRQKRALCQRQKLLIKLGLYKSPKDILRLEQLRIRLEIRDSLAPSEQVELWRYLHLVGACSAGQLKDSGFNVAGVNERKRWFDHKRERGENIAEVVRQRLEGTAQFYFDVSFHDLPGMRMETRKSGFYYGGEYLGYEQHLPVAGLCYARSYLTEHLQRGAVFVDLGFGRGHMDTIQFGKEMAGKNVLVIGVEAYAPWVAEAVKGIEGRMARNRGIGMESEMPQNLRLICRDFAKADEIGPQTVDVILASAVLPNMKDPQLKGRCLEKVIEVLKPGGRLIILPKQSYIENMAQIRELAKKNRRRISVNYQSFTGQWGEKSVTVQVAILTF